MAKKRHHAEWLSLIEISGPFLSIPILEKVFPQGLDAHDAAHARKMRVAYAEWEEDGDSRIISSTIHHNWIKFVLQETLKLTNEVLITGQGIPQTLKADIPEHGEVLQPDYLIRNPEDIKDGGKPRLLVSIYPPSQDLDKYVSGKRWKASPGTRMMELCHSTDVPLGLVTNGERWMLVYAPRGETTGFASWYAHLWLEEPITLRAFRNVLSMSRFFGALPGQTLEEMLAESATHQQEVTDQLGLQVRKAVEVLIQSLDKSDQDDNRKMLADVPETVLYEAALTVMMRLVFLFCAEERELLLLDEPLYDDNYAVSTLVAQLQETADQFGEEILERRKDAWNRLLSTFRAVYGGVQHERMKIPAYSGNLFDPDRFPFLEGRPEGTSWTDSKADPIPVNNRTVLHLLRSLQYLVMHGEAQRLSFRALDIEQIGHVYEGLLDHTAKRADETILGLIGTKNKDPEVPLSDLEKMLKKDKEELLKFLKKETGRSKNPLKKGIDPQLELEESNKLMAACGNDKKLYNRVSRFAGLIRLDTFDKPVVIREGSVYVTAGTDRRSSGTHYTPKSLTEPIVQYTLEPLVYKGPAEGKPKDKWKLKSPSELLELKICDMACGSGAFLVQACRYMSDRLVEAWEEIEDKNPGAIGITPEGKPSKGAASEQLIPKDLDERSIYAKRIVAQRCLYGVDKNPLAAEMAKLSLWLLTLSKGKPFTFLDHAIRSGDSLVGIHNLDQLKNFNLDPEGEKEFLFSEPIEDLIDEAIKMRLKIETIPSINTEDIRIKERMLNECENKLSFLKSAADMLIAAEFKPGTDSEKEDHRIHAAIITGQHLKDKKYEEFAETSKKEMNGQFTLHWPLEFPEVFSSLNGFHAFIGNPPFMGGQKITGLWGNEYRDYLVNYVANNKRGSADLCVYFLLRSASLICPIGQFSMILTNTISQGDTREVGLDQLVNNGYTILRAQESCKWPGAANLQVSLIWLRKAKWNNKYIINDNTVSGITPYLQEVGTITGNPQRLIANTNKAFIGSQIQGTGFMLDPDKASELIQKNPKNRDVIFPFLRGEDFNSSFDQSHKKYVINFFDWPLDRKSNVQGKCAREYPDCLSIIEETVKPKRMKMKGRNAIATKRANHWWLYGATASSLYKAIAGMERVLFHPFTSKYLCFAFVPANIIYSAPHIVVAVDDIEVFGLLQSNIHECWVRTYSSTLEDRMRYTPSDCFETFPRPSGSLSCAKESSVYYAYRQKLMSETQLGFTATYNKFHDPSCTNNKYVKLRETHMGLDLTVLRDYGWQDIDLNHDFYTTKQGVRFTVKNESRNEILQRLLLLNHERYEEEVQQGLHNKKKKHKDKKKKNQNQGELF